MTSMSWVERFQLNFDTLLRQSKLNRRLNTLLTCVWYISIWYLFTPFHRHFIRFRYDFLSSSLFDTLLSVSKCIWLSVSKCTWYKFECIKIVSKVNQNKVFNFDRLKSVSILMFCQGIVSHSVIYGAYLLLCMCQHSFKV